MPNSLTVPQQVNVPRTVPPYDPADPQGSLRRLIEFCQLAIPRIDDLSRGSAGTDRALSRDLTTLGAAAFLPETTHSLTGFTVADDATHNLYLLDTSIGPMAIQMPRVTAWKDRLICFTKTTGDFNPVTLRAADGTLAGAPTLTFAGDFATRLMVCDGSDWWILACCDSATAPAPGSTGADGAPGPQGPQGISGTTVGTVSGFLGSSLRRGGTFILEPAEPLTTDQVNHGTVIVQQAVHPRRPDEGEFAQILCQARILGPRAIQVIWCSPFAIRGDLRFNYLIGV